GTWLAEYGRANRLASLIRFVNDILLSAPSIVIGVFVYGVAVAPFGHFSGWSGALSLAIIMLPVVLRTTEDMMRLVPDQMREAAAALGAPRWKVTVYLVSRASLAGILTGVILGIARISGETAPLLFTALNNQFRTTDMSQPIANLPVMIFQFAMSPYDDWQHLAWAGALMITAAILVLSILARVLLRTPSFGK
ncbi:MAG TPA: phosphate ABC transporter permease PstA, partial [Gammaproteobacteria bacterium]|nr:phosphate ABC transporter permease PstA [Gammaproteobacteria bacterium]